MTEEPQQAPPMPLDEAVRALRDDQGAMRTFQRIRHDDYRARVIEAIDVVIEAIVRKGELTDGGKEE